LLLSSYTLVALPKSFPRRTNITRPLFDVPLLFLFFRTRVPVRPIFFFCSSGLVHNRPFEMGFYCSGCHSLRLVLDTFCAVFGALSCLIPEFIFWLIFPLTPVFCWLHVLSRFHAFLLTTTPLLICSSLCVIAGARFRESHRAPPPSPSLTDDLVSALTTYFFFVIGSIWLSHRPASLGLSRAGGFFVRFQLTLMP